MAKNRLYIIYCIACAVIAFIAYFEMDIHPPLSDAQNYLKFGYNILNGKGLIDIEPFNAIIPSIGYPAMVAFNLSLTELDLIMPICIFFSVYIYGLSALRLTKSYFISLLLVVFYISLIPKLISFNVEPALFFSFQLFLYLFVRAVQDPSKLTSVLCGLAFAFFILVRPLFLPIFYLMIIGILISALFPKIRNLELFKNYLLAFLGSFLLLGATSVFSFAKHGDNRMVTGTYGSVALYIAFNDYIPLNDVYYTRVWGSLPEDIQTVAKEPLLLSNNEDWQSRRKVNFQKIFNFIRKSPKKALDAYIYRLGLYSWRSIYLLHKVKFWMSLLLFIVCLVFLLRVTKNCKAELAFFLAVNGVFWYTLLMQSFWAYIGERYFVIFTPPCLVALSLNIGILLSNCTGRKERQLF